MEGRKSLGRCLSWNEAGPPHNSASFPGSGTTIPDSVVCGAAPRTFLTGFRDASLSAFPRFSAGWAALCTSVVASVSCPPGQLHPLRRRLPTSALRSPAAAHEPSNSPTPTQQPPPPVPLCHVNLSECCSHLPPAQAKTGVSHLARSSPQGPPHIRPISKSCQCCVHVSQIAHHRHPLWPGRLLEPPPHWPSCFCYLLPTATCQHPATCPGTRPSVFLLPRGLGTCASSA